MHLAALHKSPKQTVDSSKVFERRIEKNKPKIINKVTQNWKKTEQRSEKRLSQAGPRKLCLIQYFVLEQSNSIYAQKLDIESKRKK